MQTHIEKAENGYTVKFLDEYWTEDGELMRPGRGYKTTTQTLKVYSTLYTAFADIAEFYGVDAHAQEAWQHTFQTIKDLCVKGLLTDGGHHKQWVLERVLEACGFDLELLAKELAKDDYEWEPGVAP